MNELLNLNLNGNLVRKVLIDGESYFVGKDVALAIGYKSAKDTLKGRVKAEFKKKWQIDTNGGPQTMVVLSKAGLRQLINGSKLKTAKPFKDWLRNTQEF